jgi:4a-hydroxytetrahydrobiopterin dehydratase
MADRIADGVFQATEGVGDWRVILGQVEASFRAPSFAAALAFVQAIGEAAEAADHHPDVDLRYPGLLRVAMSTHVVGGITHRDVDLARTISALAAGAGVVPEPGVAQRLEVAIDALDIPAIVPFWRAALGYVDDPAAAGQSTPVLVDPARVGPQVWFQQMDEPRPQRNRIHLDVTVPDDVADARVEAALAAGGRLVTDRFARSFWVLADAEDNEVCICTWQDRD